MKNSESTKGNERIKALLSGKFTTYLGVLNNFAAVSHVIARSDNSELWGRLLESAKDAALKAMAILNKTYENEIEGENREKLEPVQQHVQKVGGLLEKLDTRVDTSAVLSEIGKNIEGLMSKLQDIAKNARASFDIDLNINASPYVRDMHRRFSDDVLSKKSADVNHSLKPLTLGQKLLASLTGYGKKGTLVNRLSESVKSVWRSVSDVATTVGKFFAHPIDAIKEMGRKSQPQQEGSVKANVPSKRIKSPFLWSKIFPSVPVTPKEDESRLSDKQLQALVNIVAPILQHMRAICNLHMQEKDKTDNKGVVMAIKADLGILKEKLQADGMSIDNLPRLKELGKKGPFVEILKQVVAMDRDIYGVLQKGKENLPTKLKEINEKVDGLIGDIKSKISAKWSQKFISAAEFDVGKANNALVGTLNGLAPHFNKICSYYSGVFGKMDKEYRTQLSAQLGIVNLYLDDQMEIFYQQHRNLKDKIKTEVENVKEEIEAVRNEISLDESMNDDVWSKIKRLYGKVKSAMEILGAGNDSMDKFDDNVFNKVNKETRDDWNKQFLPQNNASYTK
jgi:hypothetical protein